MTDTAFRREFGDQFFDRYWQLKPDGPSLSAITVTPIDSSCRMRRHAARRYRAARALARGAAQYRSRYAEPGRPCRLGDARERFSSERWWLTELRAWQWNPSAVQRRGAVRDAADLEYAPLEERLRTFLARLANVPAYYAAAKSNVAARRASNAARDRAEPRRPRRVRRRARARDRGVEMAPAERSGIRQRLPAGARSIEDYVGWLEALEASSRAAQSRRARSGSAASSTPRSSRSTSNRAIPPKRSTSARSPRRDPAVDAHVATRGPAVAEVLSRTLPPRRQLDKIGQVIARLSEQHVPREQLVRRSNSRFRSSSAGCATTTWSSSTRPSR